MKSRMLICVVLALLAFVAGHEVAENQVLAKCDQESQFIVGVLRADGILIPFAQYSNGGWANPWPPSNSAGGIYAESREATHSLEDLPEPWFKQCGQVPRTWYFWSSAAAPIVLKASKVLKVRAHSLTNWALSTNLPGRTSEDALDNEIGIASSAKVKVDKMIGVSSKSPEDYDIAPDLKYFMEFAETEEVNRWRGQHPPESAIRQFALTKEERAKIQMSITKLYRSKPLNNGEYLYYFEAEKSYPNPGADATRSCEDVSLYRGWISARGKGGWGFKDSQLTFTNCDRKGPSTATPLGIMTLKNRVFLFVKEHGWESASYMILELDNSGLHLLLETIGG